MKKWQWDSHDIAKFRKNRGIDITALLKQDAKGDLIFKYRGKLVPELKEDILLALTAAQLKKSSRRKNGQPESE